MTDLNKRKRRVGKPQIEKAAEIYAKNKSHDLGMTDKDVIVAAGYSEKSNPYQIMKSDTFKKRLEELVPQDKVLKRVNKGLDNPKDTTALGYVKVAAEMHGMTGAKASNININTEGGAVNLAQLLNWTPQGEYKDE